LTTAWKFRIPGHAAWRVTDDAQLIEAMRPVWEIVPLAEQRKPLTPEVIEDLWRRNGGFYHHFARAVIKAAEENT
jgi:hypothetical protein